MLVLATVPGKLYFLFKMIFIFVLSVCLLILHIYYSLIYFNAGSGLQL